MDRGFYLAAVVISFFIGFVVSAVLSYNIREPLLISGLIKDKLRLECLIAGGKWDKPNCWTYERYEKL